MCVLMLNEVLILQLLTTSVLIFFLTAINIITLWYLSGVYLFTLGFLLLLDDSGIFVGFLWVVDLGVGLIFFIFILHFSNFLHQKAALSLMNRYTTYYPFLILILLGFFLFFSSPVDQSIEFNLQKSWIFLVSWYNYYAINSSYIISELNLLREIYFYNNSFGFFIINFMLCYGIFGAITLSFLVKRLFNFLNFSQLKNYKMLNELGTSFFIRTQNFIKQQNTSTGTRVWVKNKQFFL